MNGRVYVGCRSKNPFFDLHARMVPEPLAGSPLLTQRPNRKVAKLDEPDLQAFVVYRAEHVMEEIGLVGEHFADAEVASQWITPIAASLGACRRTVGGRPSVQVILTKNMSVYGGSDSTSAMTSEMGSIVVREGSLQQLNLLHETAHLALQSEGLGGHGREFVALVEKLYAKHLSAEAGRVFGQEVGRFADVFGPETARTVRRSRPISGPSFGGLA